MHSIQVDLHEDGSKIELIEDGMSLTVTEAIGQDQSILTQLSNMVFFHVRVFYTVHNGILLSSISNSGT